MQVIFAAIACKVKRFIRLGFLHGYVVSVTAVTTPSAAVSAAQTAFNSFFLHVLSLIYVSDRKSPEYQRLGHQCLAKQGTVILLKNRETYGLPSSVRAVIVNCGRFSNKFN